MPGPVAVGPPIVLPEGRRVSISTPPSTLAIATLPGDVRADQVTRDEIARRPRARSPRHRSCCPRSRCPRRRSAADRGPGRARADVDTVDPVGIRGCSSEIGADQVPLDECPCSLWSTIRPMPIARDPVCVLHVGPPIDGVSRQRQERGDGCSLVVIALPRITSAVASLSMPMPARWCIK